MKQNGWRTGRIQRTHTLDAYTAGIAADLGSRALIGGRFYPYITATCAAIHRSTTRSRLADHDDVRRTHMLSRPGRSVRGERANLKGLVLGCIEAKNLQQNMRWKALAYTMHSFAPFSTLNFLFLKLLIFFCYFLPFFSGAGG